jgi:cytochrome c
MLDTMTFTKVLGAFCGALLVFLLGKWAAEMVYHMDDAHSSRQAAYVIDTGADEAVADAEPEEEVDFAELLASADASAGERLWRQCAACHVVDQERNGTGPHLVGIVGRGKGDVEGFAYSDYFVGNDEVWTAEALSGFIENPREYAPGTRMAYGGMSSAGDRANLIAYLDQF